MSHGCYSENVRGGYDEKPEVMFNLKKQIYENKVDNKQAITDLSVQLIELRDTINVALNNISKTLLKLK